MGILCAHPTELNLVKKCISSGDVVFDVGAHLGYWTDLVLKMNPSEVHLFEPIKVCYENLIKRFSGYITKGQIFVSDLAVFRHEGVQDFYLYPNHLSLSTLHRRIQAEKACGLGDPNKPLSILVTTIDRYCLGRIQHIHYLKIDTEGAELDVIIGAERLLIEHNIDYIEFEYGGTYLDSGITLKEVHSYLKRKGYTIFKALPDELKHIPEVLPEHEDYEFAIFLACVDKKE